MGTQKVKEAPAEGKPAAKPKEQVVKKWKGKEWFTVHAPGFLGGREIGEIPATDPKSVVGRNLDVALSTLLGNPSKYFMKYRFKIDQVEGNQATTTFHGFHLIKEQVFRVTRKRTSKVELVRDLTTTDGWKLHFKLFVVMNRSSNTELQRKVRNKAGDLLTDFVTKASLADVLKTSGDGLIQKNIKKFTSKIYPIRFCEIVKIEVVAPGETPKPASPRAPPQETRAPPARKPIVKTERKETKKEPAKKEAAKEAKKETKKEPAKKPAAKKEVEKKPG